MSLRALHSAATGMESHQFALDTIANNLANASTTAFKRSRANFEDLYYEHPKLPGTQATAGQTGIGTAVGLGTRISSTSVDYRTGSALQTESPLDLMVVGEGFFEVDDGGRPAYTRMGNFTKNADGNLVLASADSGRVLQPPIQLPANAMNITISGDGQVVYDNGQGNYQQAGQLKLVRFINNQGLMQKGESLYVPTLASGQPVEGQPGLDGFGQIRQGYLEASNVEPVRELVDLIKTQRNFELNSQIIQAADQMLQLVSNLRRF